MVQGFKRAYAALGWRLHAVGQPLRISSVVSDELAVATIRSYDGCSHEAIPDDDRVRIVLMQSGTVEGSHAGSPFTLSPGTVTLMRSTDSANGTVISPSSRLAMQLPAGFFESRRFGNPWGDPTPIDAEQMHSFLAFCRSYLRVGATAVPEAAEDFAHATALFLRGMLAAAAGGQKNAPAHRQDNNLRAMHEVIESNFRDPDFSVSQLAQQLFISESSLRRLCANVYTTPHAEIRQRRAREAMSLLGGEPPLSGELGDSVARSAGFRSRVMMYRSLAKMRNNRVLGYPADSPSE